MFIPIQGLTFVVLVALGLIFRFWTAPQGEEKEWDGEQEPLLGN